MTIKTILILLEEKLEARRGLQDGRPLLSSPDYASRDASCWNVSSEGCMCNSQGTHCPRDASLKKKTDQNLNRCL
jgi:hypothetical protein